MPNQFNSEIRITGRDTSGPALRKFNRNTREATAAQQRFNSSLKAGAGLAAGYLAGTALTSGLTGIVQATVAYDEAYRGIEQRTGEVVASQVAEWAKVQEAITGIPDEVTLAIAKIITEINEPLPLDLLITTISLSQDAAAILSEFDAIGTGQEFGEFLAIPSAQFDVIEKFGTIITQVERDAILAAEAVGDLEKAQRLLIKVLADSSFSGAAERRGNTLFGALSKVQTALNNLITADIQSSGVNRFINALNDFSTALRSDTAVNFAQSLTSDLFDNLARIIEGLNEEKLTDAIEDIKDIFSNLQVILGYIIPTLGIVGGGYLLGKGGGALNRAGGALGGAYSAGTLAQRQGEERARNRLIRIPGEGARELLENMQAERALVNSRKASTAAAGATKALTAGLTGLLGAIGGVSGGVLGLIGVLLLYQDEIADFIKNRENASFEARRNRRVGSTLGTFRQPGPGAALTNTIAQSTAGSTQRSIDRENAFLRYGDEFRSSVRDRGLAKVKTLIIEKETSLGRLLTTEEKLLIKFNQETAGANEALAKVNAALEDRVIVEGDAPEIEGFLQRAKKRLLGVIKELKPAYDEQLKTLKAGQKRDAVFARNAKKREEDAEKAAKAKMKLDKDSADRAAAASRRLNASALAAQEILDRRTSAVEALLSYDRQSQVQNQLNTLRDQIYIGGGELGDRELSHAQNQQSVLENELSLLKAPGISTLANILNTDEAGAVEYGRRVGNQFSYAFSSAFNSILTDGNADFLQNLQKGLNQVFANVASKLLEQLLVQGIGAAFGVNTPRGGGGLFDLIFGLATNQLINAGLNSATTAITGKINTNFGGYTGVNNGGNQPLGYDQNGNPIGVPNYPGNSRNANAYDAIQVNVTPQQAYRALATDDADRDFSAALDRHQSQIKGYQGG